ncbi:MAG: ATP-binding protein [Bacteroidales bacterium]|jgi:AAA+ ATPase superfamily predicted ATPase|nr:ATP-binding protein [Bacteroidales bacterium]
MKIIGRIDEQNELQQYVESEAPEFIAVYGRRRVGKTFLIKEFFDNTFSFYATGLDKAETTKQLSNFNSALNKYGQIRYRTAKNWIESFEQLIHLLEHSKTKKRKVIFIDELPWLDTPRSGFITALEFFWNSWASSHPEILLIVCGSATSWMINHLVKNKGGLHNRVTRRMQIEPFTLCECETFLQHKKISMDRKSIVELYMIFGGIPFYLNMIEKKRSLPQNVDNLCFSKKGALKDEFSLLYASLFKNAVNHIKVIHALGKKTKGLTRSEISKASKMQGGGLTTVLEELEQCGFIRKYKPFEKRAKCALYQLVDFYTLFHLRYVKTHGANRNFWSSMTDNPQHRAWSGYAFEMVCLMHEYQIQQALGISGVLTETASWRSLETTPAAQIDLVINRNDNVVNLCEIKYAKELFTIDRKYANTLIEKKNAFIKETKTRKAVHLTMITTFGVTFNEHFNNIQSSVVMDDLFK